MLRHSAAVAALAGSVLVAADINHNVGITYPWSRGPMTNNGQTSRVTWSYNDCVDMVWSGVASNAQQMHVECNQGFVGKGPDTWTMVYSQNTTTPSATGGHYLFCLRDAKPQPPDTNTCRFVLDIAAVVGGPVTDSAFSPDVSLNVGDKRAESTTYPLPAWTAIPGSTSSTPTPTPSGTSQSDTNANGTVAAQQGGGLSREASIGIGVGVGVAVLVVGIAVTCIVVRVWNRRKAAATAARNKADAETYNGHHSSIMYAGTTGAASSTPVSSYASTGYKYGGGAGESLSPPPMSTHGTVDHHHGTPAELATRHEASELHGDQRWQ